MSLLDITVATPAHLARVNNGMLHRAIQSAWCQTAPPVAVALALDIRGEGAPKTRQRALEMVKTPWTAFLDSDDEFGPEHLEKLSRFALDTDADYVYSWFTIPQTPDWDPLNGFGKPFDPANPKQTTITVLVRTDLALQAGGFWQPPVDAEIDGQRYGEDYAFTCACNDLGARILHLPERTWFWSHHGGNTSGRPDQGDAVIRR